MTTFVELLISGVTFGCVYGLIAGLLSLTHRASGLLNLAVGAFVMYGVLGTNWVMSKLHVDVGLAGLIVVVTGAIISAAFDGLVITKLRSAIGDRLGVLGFLLTLALGLAIEGLAYALVGTNIVSLPVLATFDVHLFGSVSVQSVTVLVVAVTVVVWAAVILLERYLLIGKALLASGDSALGCAVSGVRGSTLRRIGFVASCTAAALLGVIIAPLSAYGYLSGTTFLIVALVSGALVGFDRPAAALGVGLCFGLAESLIGGYVNANYNELILLFAGVAMIIVVQQRWLPLLIGSFGSRRRQWIKPQQ